MNHYQQSKVMKTITAKRKQPGNKADQPLGEFATAGEAAKAKTADLMRSLEKTDLSFLQKK
jgi:hypothetical protein